MNTYNIDIKPKKHLLKINFKEIWFYRDLLYMFVKRSIITVYKQTILGPIWFIVQPIMTTGMYMLVFGRIANISTDGLPQILFYLSGIVIWNYFHECFNQTAHTFNQNAQIFGKVYFPRLIIPFAEVLSGLIKFFIQLAIFIIIYLYFLYSGNTTIQPNWTLALVPVYIVLMAGIGLAAGLIFSSLTTKYRDLNHLLTFGIQLLMYATPVIYPVSTVPEKYKIFIQANPLTPVLEGFKYAFLGAGHFSWQALAYSGGFMTILLFMGIIIFHQTERNFIDTV
ncbi:ABC transporter permease [Methylobacter marinus]|jgi:homopolymeric O-antigen transport system permease protein|uniref:ABC transporter permease n=1 Tax=Methylobacter marinus TaxID=34058 RepID=UPI00036A538D|nr:ABC transporter permease [Methylobacter marinus]